ncbi:DNA helicase loader [Proteus phage phiP4-3]|uniref:DNA helicase loading protein n=1 Tax=Proteus phage phiP4-3 TaxID=2065203 RepID=A0A2I6PF80_9CAUD|nr:DNA helicase loader [Proteus phage phiP4-3]AUM58381.1 DNA helicase loading protein [Proteus phage phiP4-3]QQV89484.1 DNA helicase loading protein [Proteus phage SJ_PmiM]
MIKVRIPHNSNRYITGKSVYQLYLMLKNHMNGKYDVIKYNWTMRISDAAYNKRRDKYFFEKLSDKYKLNELVYIFISNLVANQDAWIGEISDADALVFYREYIGKLQGLSDVYKEDLKNIYYFSKKINVSSLKDIFEYNTKTQTSYIFKLLQSNIIGYETFILLDSFLGLINKHDQCSTDLVWSTYSTKLSSYKKLLEIDSETAKKVFVETINACKY